MGSMEDGTHLEDIRGRADGRRHRTRGEAGGRVQVDVVLEVAGLEKLGFEEVVATQGVRERLA